MTLFTFKSKGTGNPIVRTISFAINCLKSILSFIAKSIKKNILSFYRFIVPTLRRGNAVSDAPASRYTQHFGNGPLLEQLKKVIINASSVSAGIKHRVMQ
jgi:hypothetical protein